MTDAAANYRLALIEQARAHDAQYPHMIFPGGHIPPEYVPLARRFRVFLIENNAWHKAPAGAPFGW